MKIAKYSKNPKRDWRIWSLRRQGFTYAHIAKVFDLTDERVRQICVAQSMRGVKP